MKRILILTPTYIVALISLSCSHLSSTASSAPVSLNLSGVVNQTDQYAIFMQTLVENIKDGDVVNQKMDIADFEVKTQITKIDDNKNVHIVSTTTKKDGSLDLHGMAYPELNEKIEFVFNKFGDVVKAGNYPPKSLFFVPPLPLPQKMVRVGDTWKYNGEWTSATLQGAMQLKLDMVLKKIIPCFEKETCAGIEWNGTVLPISPGIELPLQSTIHGYTLYRPKTGSQLWTYTRNVESFQIQNLKMQVSTCVQSILKTDQSGLNPFIKKDPYCDPSKNEMDYFQNPN